ncbi:MAG: response regulator [Synergistaceae bacterium]|jgi:signal transduction histidine kinase/ligand-binding sensor domain-containing protein/CheY-like chemotaxis protein|nr:response regulator [Synergistaceae bacterium]
MEKRACNRYKLWFTAILTIVLFELAAEPLWADRNFLSEYIQTRFSENSEIPVTTTNEVIQTRDGYIWVASYDGLVRFDGQRSRVFGKADGSLPTNNIYTLFEDSRGRLWIGTNDAGLGIFENGRFTFIKESDGLPSPSIRSIIEDSRGNIYVATTSGLVTISREQTISHVKTPDGKPILAVSIAISARDELWCVQNDGSVTVVNDGTVTSPIPAGHFGGLTLHSVFCSEDGSVYLGAYGGNVFVRDPASGEYTTLSAGEINSINGFYEDRGGRIWVYADNGIGYFEDGRFNSLDGALVSNSMENMMEDYEGNYWFASSRSGVLLLSRAKLKNMFFAYGLPDRTVNAVIKYHGDLYVGTDNGMLIIGPDGENISGELTETLQGIRVRALAVDSEDNLWIGTYQNFGVIRYKNGEWVSINAKNGLTDERVRSIWPSGSGGVVVGTSNGVSIVRDDKVTRSYAADEGLTMPVILNVIEAKDGAIYAGSDGGGIYKIEDGLVSRNITTKDGLASGVILRMAIDEASGGIWVSTGNGVCFIDGSGVRRIDKLSGYDNNIFDIRIIGDDGLWLLGSPGVYICGRSNLLSEAPLRIETIGKQDGLTSPPTANALNYMSDDNILYISCTRGIHRIDTQNVYKNEIEPKLAVNSVTIDEKVLETPNLAETITVPAYARRIIIDFALLSYIKSDKNKVSVYLDGFDKAPSAFDMSLATSVSYTNLAGGEYALRLAGTNAYDVPAKEIVLRIKKSPKLFEMPQTWGAFLAAALAFAFFAAKLYHKYKSLQKDKLLIGVNKAASLLIADIHDDMDVAVWGALKILGESVGAKSAFLWRNGCGGDTPKASRISLWLRDGRTPDNACPISVDVPVASLLPAWNADTDAGPKSVVLDVGQISDSGVPSEIFGETKYFTAIPIVVQEGLWGFIGFANHTPKQSFSGVQIDILASGGLLAASAIMRGEMILDFIEAREKALAGTKAKSDFLARMSHEIRTPMNAVIGLGELAVKEYGSPKGFEYIAGIKQAGLNLLAIINDILDFSKIESGNLQMIAAPYETSSLINDAMGMIGVRLKDKPIRFVTDIDADLPSTMIGDESRVKQVLLNLLSNAVKYTNEGFIKFGATGRRVGDDVINLSFVVEDSGIGIKPEDVGKLFGDFVRVNELQNRYVEGTGLGLSITRNLCRVMGGDVAVESEYGKGSTFTATLVQRIANAVPLGAADGKMPVLGDGADARFTAPDFHVLIVDDITTNLMVMEGLLAAYEVKITTCLSGAEAINLVKSKSFDLVFMDHMMPGMDGVETTSAIRAMEGDYFAWVPIIALTANAVSGMREMFLENGFTDYLAKPVEIPKLNEMMERWVPMDKRELAGPSETPPPEIDPGIDGLDFARGIRFYGGTGAYLQILRSYSVNTSELLGRLRNLSPDTLSDYAIAVHGLKGASLGICADALGKKAEYLERLAKAGDFETARKENEPLIRMAESLLASLNEFLKNVPASGTGDSPRKKRLPSPDEALLQRMLAASRRSMSSEMESILTELERYEYESGGDLVEWLRGRIDDLEYEAVAERLK